MHCLTMINWFIIVLLYTCISTCIVMRRREPYSGYASTRIRITPRRCVWKTWVFLSVFCSPQCQNAKKSGTINRENRVSLSSSSSSSLSSSSPTHIREYVNTRRTIHPPIYSWRPSVPCGCFTCLEFLATQCSVYVVAGFLLSVSKDSPVRCVISSLTLNAIFGLLYSAPATVSVTASLKSYSFIHSFIHHGPFLNAH